MLLNDMPLREALMGLLFYFMSSTMAICGTHEVPGLDIQNLPDSLYDPGSHSCKVSGHYLDCLLEGSYFPKSQVSLNVVTSFAEADDDNSKNSSKLTDTDIESMGIEKKLRVEKEETYDTNLCLFALNSKPNENDSKKKNLLRENEVNWDKGFFTEHLCSKLAQDACHIVNTHKSAITRSVTTCFCVVLRDEYGRAKKFVFHNDKEKMSATMAQKAKELKYAIRTGYQAHAEAEFIQFLLQRKQQKKERYTHILGMGCSRRHCQECDSLLKLFLGKQYYRFTSAMDETASLPAVANVENGCEILCKIHARIVYQTNAVNKDGRRSDKYYLPRVLQDHIKEKAVLDLDFSSDRFVIKNEEDMIERRQRSGKKRRSEAIVKLTQTYSH